MLGVIEMTINDCFKELLKHIYTELLKPKGWKKQGNDFRFIREDGIGQIINFQKSKWSTSEKCDFFINYGIYIEAEQTLTNKAYKEYDCQLRRRAHKADTDEMFTIHSCDLSEVKKDTATAIHCALAFFDFVETKEHFVKMLLSGEAQTYSYTIVMHYHTCKLLCEMGYYQEIGEIIKDKSGEYFDELKNQIEQKASQQFPV